MSQAGTEFNGRTHESESITTRRVVSPVLVGRASELELLVSGVCNPPSVAVVKGEAGIGKTRLVEELLGRPELNGNGNGVLLGRCHRIREPFPLGPVIEAARSIDYGARLEFSPLVGALRPLLPELAHVLPAAPPPLGDRAAERHRSFRALAEVLGARGEQLVVLEDLHWAEDHTIEFLRFLLADPPKGLALVLTYRVEEASDALRGLTARLPSSMGRQDIALAPLSEVDTRALATAILGVPDVSSEFVASLRERTSGIPFAIEEIVALLHDRALLAKRGERWAHRALDDISVPAAIADSVLERTANLSSDAAAVVEAAALLRVASSLRVIAATSELSEKEAEGGLSEAVALGLLQNSGGNFGFRHVLGAEAIEATLSGPRKRALHERAATSLQASESCPLGQIAHHLRFAGKIGEWARYAEEAADHSARLGDDAEPVRLLKDVLRDAPLDPAGRARVARKLAHSALHSLAHAETIKILEKTIDHEALPQIERGQLRLSFARLLANSGDIGRRSEQIKQAVRELEGNPSSQALAMSWLVLPFGLDVPIDEHAAWMRRALGGLAKIDDPVVDAAVLGNCASLLLAMGDKAWREMLGRMPRQPMSLEHEKEIERVLVNVACDACYLGHFGVAKTLIERGVARAERIRYERMRLFFKARRALLDYGIGNWHRLSDTVDAQFEDVADLPGLSAELGWVSGCLWLAQADLAKAQHRLECSTTLAEDLQSTYELGPPAGALARIHLARKNPRAAIESAMRCISVLEAKGLWTLGGPAVPWAVQARVATHERDKAALLAERFTAGIRNRDAPMAAAAALVCRGILEDAGGLPQDAAESFTAAAAAYERLPHPYETAQAKERAAHCLVMTRRDAARQTFLDALDIYRSLGAAWDAARCARTARSDGISLPRPYRGGRRGYGMALTPRELEVARLAAARLSNREIAHKLFLSTKTVENYLGRAMAKLKVHSRADIAGHLSPAPETVGRGFEPSEEADRRK